ncbi:hypothetical protein ZWY2020_000755 [Hordeum vulgare]|nr:hypothetical protein ZWY2020_000755 [Hordeum vulgare]
MLCMVVWRIRWPDTIHGGRRQLCPGGWLYFISYLHVGCSADYVLLGCRNEYLPTVPRCSGAVADAKPKGRCTACCSGDLPGNFSLIMMNERASDASEEPRHPASSLKKISIQLLVKASLQAFLQRRRAAALMVMAVAVTAQARGAARVLVAAATASRVGGSPPSCELTSQACSSTFFSFSTLALAAAAAAQPQQPGWRPATRNVGRSSPAMMTTTCSWKSIAGRRAGRQFSPHRPRRLAVPVAVEVPESFQ